MLRNEYDQIIRENFDLSDNYTRRYIVSLKEDSQRDNLITALSISLYDSIVSKVDDIDFGTIPMSRGDITKVQGFEGTLECLRTIRQLVLEYKQNPSVVDVVLAAIDNVRSRTGLFMKGYSLDAEFPMLMYNLIVLSIERSTSLMIATSIQFIKDPSSDTPKKALDKVAYSKTMEDMLFKQLMVFNNLCAKGDFDKTMDASMKAIREDVSVDFDGETILPVADEVPAPVEGEVDDDLFGSEPFGDENTPSAAPEPEVETVPAQEPELDPMVANNSEVDPVDQAMDGAVAEPQETPVSEPEAPTEPTVEDDDPMAGATAAVPYASEADPKDEPIDTSVAPNSVDPENIPAVVPGDSITSTDAPITEEEVQEDATQTITGIVNVLTQSGSKSNNKFVAAGAAAIKILSVAALLWFAPKVIGFTFKNVIIPMIRNMIYSFVYTKAKFSVYLVVQADLLESNANDLEVSTNSGLDDKAKENAVKKQRKIADKLRKWSNFFAIDKKQTENKVKQAQKDDEKRKKKVAKDEDGDDALF